MTNEGQLPMMKNMLNSALKCGMPMHLFHCYILTSDKEVASYDTTRFKHITTRKLEVIRMNMEMGTILWVDNDIVFFENCLADILSKPGSFVMQNDGWSMCTGFFLARPSLFSKQIIDKSITWLKGRQGVQNDQHAFQESCKTTPIMITSLCREEYPNGETYFNLKIQSKARMVHSNCIKTTAKKVQRFKDHGMWNDSDEGFNYVYKYAI
jgi:Nucleotide-diphospho-sugar transferase